MRRACSHLHHVHAWSSVQQRARVSPQLRARVHSREVALALARLTSCRRRCRVFAHKACVAALSPPPPNTGRDLPAERAGSGVGVGETKLAAEEETSLDVPPPYGQSESLWTLLLLSTCYLHASACSYALPALLPDVSLDLGLDDAQSAVLTSAALLTYSLLLIPAGAAADNVDRPRLLALGALLRAPVVLPLVFSLSLLPLAGVALWSAATAMSAVAPTFPVLLASRFLYAAGYATQNPISMGIVPELFPRQRASAMAAYNTAIHLGRAVSFGAGALAVPPPVVVRGAAMAASSLAAAVMSPGGGSTAGMPEFPPAGAVTLPIERLEDVANLGGMGILYMTGDLLVLTPIMGSNEGGISIGETARAGAAAAMAAVGLSWRDVMLGIALPGLVLAPLLIATVRDPGRTQDGASRATRRRMRMAGGATEGDGMAEGFTTLVDSLREVFSSSPWRLITAAAVMTDFGAWALISFQSTFYERVFGLSAATYSPVLACILPIAGIAGGVGGSLLVDRLVANGNMQQRRLLLVGASLLAAPVMTASLLAPDWITSVVALLPATALAEVWRAPATVIVRDAAPKGAPGAATAAYLAVRNALCGLGPVTAAWLTHMTDLRHALLITPAALVAAAGLFYAAEVALDNERTQREAATE